MKMPNQKQEKNLHKKGFKYIAGIDEAGRGCLAGPIVAAAVIFAQKTRIKGINDSKKLTANKREIMAAKIKEKAKAFSIEKISARQIDKLGIQKANELVIKKAIRKLKIKPDFILLDAIKIKMKTSNKSIIKGDEKIFSIAAASILAKTERDKLMLKAHLKFPHYGFDQHVGYGTKKHFKSLKKNGPCPLHRITFRPLNNLKTSDII